MNPPTRNLFAKVDLGEVNSNLYKHFSDQQMIRNFSDFSSYRYKASNDVIFCDDLEFGISGINYKSKTLLIQPSSKSLNPISHYDSLEFIEFNNYNLAESEFEILRSSKSAFKKVSHLSFWNTKLSNLKVLEFFKNVQYLCLAHISGQNFTFDGIDNLGELKTLCLLKTGKVKDLSSLNIKSKIDNFSLIQPTNIKDTVGIGNLQNLKYLNIEGSLDKVYSLEKLSDLDSLPSLEEVQLHRIYIPFDELIAALNLPFNIQLNMDANVYSTEQYKELSLELKNVKSNTFKPYLDMGTYVQPIGKGKRIIKKSDKKYEQKINMLVEEWNK